MAHGTEHAVSRGTRSHGRWLPAVSFLVLTAIGAAYALALFAAARRNTLFDNGHWDSSKVSLRRAVMTSISFFVTRPALHRDRLNLGAWFGFQEVLHREPADLAEIEFDFMLSAGAYVAVEYRRTERDFWGMRLSARPGFPSAFFHASSDGGFIEKRPIQAPALQEGANHAKIVLGRTQTTLSINGSGVGIPSAVPPGHGRWGFRGSQADAYVWNITARTRDGRLVRETFAPRGVSQPFARALAAIALLDLLVLVIFGRLKRLRAAPVLPLAVMHLTVLVGSIALYELDRVVLAALHPRREPDYRGLTIHYESPEAVSERLHRTYAYGRLAGRHRIVLIGSSQTWGAGATVEEQTWARQLEARLGHDRVQIINTGMSGLVASELVDLYRRDWIRYEPDLVVVNVASNDTDAGDLAANVAALLQLNNVRGIRTLVSLEANTTEVDNQALRERHEKLRAVAQTAEVPVVDLHGCLEQQADTGFLWWDFVHLTDFGQKQASDCLYPEVKRLISMRDDPR